MAGLIAFCYDFDKTLSPQDMQAQGLIQSLGMSVEEFWNETDRAADAGCMDGNLSYMRLLLEKARGRFDFTREKLRSFGKQIEFFPGLDDWFSRVNAYASSHGLKAEHYIISCGIKEIIEGTGISGNFKQVYASYYCYDEDGLACWPAQVVNFTNKTQFLYRIKKGSLDVNDMSVNDYVKSSDVRIPFDNFIYIGDSDTDIPCMSIVNRNGGYPIGVYDPEVSNRNKVEKLLHENRIRFFAPADYTEGSRLFKMVCAIIDKIACDMRLDGIARGLANE